MPGRMGSGVHLAQNRLWFTSTPAWAVVYRPSWREIFSWILSSGVCIVGEFRNSEPAGFGSGEASLFSLHRNFNCARDNPPFFATTNS
jgi:hypothetical protein